MKYLWALALSAIAATAAPVSYQVSIDLSAYGFTNGSTGFLDLQFNGAGVGTPNGTADVTAFTTSNVLIDELNATVDGNVTGTLVPGPLNMLNNNVFALNAYVLPFSITGLLPSFTFQVTLDGDILNPPPGNLLESGFLMALYSTGAPNFDPYGGVGTDPFIGRIDVNTVGAISTSVVTGTTISAVPEPGFGLTAAALCLALGLYRRQRA